MFSLSHTSRRCTIILPGGLACRFLAVSFWDDSIHTMRVYHSRRILCIINRRCSLHLYIRTTINNALYRQCFQYIIVVTVTNVTPFIIKIILIYWWHLFVFAQFAGPALSSTWRRVVSVRYAMCNCTRPGRCWASGTKLYYYCWLCLYRCDFFNMTY